LGYDRKISAAHFKCLLYDIQYVFRDNNTAHTSVSVFFFQHLLGISVAMYAVCRSFVSVFIESQKSPGGPECHSVSFNVTRGCRPLPSWSCRIVVASYVVDISSLPRYDRKRCVLTVAVNEIPQILFGIHKKRITDVRPPVFLGDSSEKGSSGPVCRGSKQETCNGGKYTGQVKYFDREADLVNISHRKNWSISLYKKCIQNTNNQL